MRHWLADVQFGSFAPALVSLIFNSLCPSADGQRMPIASVVSSNPKKNEKQTAKRIYIETINYHNIISSDNFVLWTEVHDYRQ